MIRLASWDDLESVTDIYNQAIDAGFQTAFTTRFSPVQRAEWLGRHLNLEYPLFVDDNSGVDGWLSVSPYREGRDALRRTVEVSYFVRSGRQGRGIGSALLAHAVAAMRRYGHHTALAIILDPNIASIRMAERAGFKQWGYLPGVAEFNGIVCGQYYYGLQLDTVMKNS